jgi:hypothetical protein
MIINNKQITIMKNQDDQTYKIKDHPDVVQEIHNLAPHFHPTDTPLTEEEIKSTAFYEIVQNVTNLDASLKYSETEIAVTYMAIKIATIAATSPKLKTIKLSEYYFDSDDFFHAFQLFAQSPSMPSIGSIDVSDNNSYSYDWVNFVKCFTELNFPIHTFIMQKNRLHDKLPEIVEVLIKIPTLRKIDLGNNGSYLYPERTGSKYEESKEKAKAIVDEFNKKPVTENYSLLFGTWALHECGYLPQDITNLILGHSNPVLELEL